MIADNYRVKTVKNSLKNGNSHSPKGGKRYQFNGVIVHYDSKSNSWYVIKSSEPNWRNTLYEITGIENENIALELALDYIKSENGKRIES